MTPNPFVLDLRGSLLDCGPGQAHVMGILNVTPDSFSDGGAYLDPGAARARAVQMAEEGAVLIDVGGASSRPKGATYGAGAQPVSAQEERQRVLPVVRAIASSLPGILISVDTFHASVAEAVLEEGAHLINDITGLRHDPRLADLAARFGAGLALMHSVGLVGEMPHAVEHEDIVATVSDFLQKAADHARSAGVESLLLDPGFGFGKSVEDNFRLIQATDRLVAAGHPVLVGVSRKSSIGVALGEPGNPVPVEDRLFGSLGTTAVALMRGASVVRTHDVAQTVQMIRGMDAALRPGT